MARHLVVDQAIAGSIPVGRPKNSGKQRRCCRYCGMRMVGAAPH